MFFEIDIRKNLYGQPCWFVLAAHSAGASGKIFIGFVDKNAQKQVLTQKAYSIHFNANKNQIDIRSGTDETIIINRILANSIERDHVTDAVIIQVDEEKYQLISDDIQHIIKKNTIKSITTVDIMLYINNIGTLLALDFPEHDTSITPASYVKQCIRYLHGYARALDKTQTVSNKGLTRALANEEERAKEISAKSSPGFFSHKKSVSELDWSKAIEIKVRVFIPSPAVGLTLLDNRIPIISIFGGDERGPSYSEGTSRLELTIHVLLDSGIEKRTMHLEASHKYDSENAVAVDGKPAWWLNLKPGAIPTKVSREPITNKNFTGNSQRDANGKVTVTFGYHASNSALSIPAPSIDGNFTLIFDTDNSMIVYGEHDGFPRHTIYVNQTLIYDYDPVAGNSSPNNLFPPCDVVVDRHMRSIPEKYLMNNIELK